MVVMLKEGKDAGFFVLSRNSSKAKATFSLWPWPAGDIVKIAGEDTGSVSDTVMDVLGHGIPIPRDGSVLGWVDGDSVTALIVTYAESAPDPTEPGWAVMPLAGTPEAQWPPFTGERLFGHWSWEGWRAGRIVSLERVISTSPGTVWWVDTEDVVGSNCCAVARDIPIPKGQVLRRGCYVYYQVLLAGEPIPSLEVLLGTPGKVDLAPRFRPQADRQLWPITAQHAPG
jgi:hypothetical protein